MSENKHRDALEKAIQIDPGISSKAAAGRIANQFLSEPLTDSSWRNVWHRHPDVKRWLESEIVRLSREVSVEAGGGVAPDDSQIIDTLEAVGVIPSTSPYYWDKRTSDISAFVRNPHYVEGGITYQELQARIIDTIESYAPGFPPIHRPTIWQEKHALVLDICDAHAYKLGIRLLDGSLSYDLDIFKERMVGGVERLLEMVSGFNITKIYLIDGGDNFHVDADKGKSKNSTSSGTPMDVAGVSWWDAYLYTFEVMRQVIDKLIDMADVHFIVCNGNHNKALGLTMGHALSALFSDHPNFTSDVSLSDRKYARFFGSLMGFTHGEKVKGVKLHAQMTFEARKEWAIAKAGYWYVHHTHHIDVSDLVAGSAIKVEKEESGVVVASTGLVYEPENRAKVETVSSISGTDQWHHDYGFNLATARMSCFVHSEVGGEIGRFGVNF